MVSLVIQMQRSRSLEKLVQKKMQWQSDVPEKSQDRVSAAMSEEQVSDPSLTRRESWLCLL